MFRACVIEKLLVLLMILTATVSPNACAYSTAKVFVQPQSTVIEDVGETFTVDVNVANVSNLYGYEFKLFYNTTILDGIKVELPLGHFLTPTQSSTNIFIAKQETKDDFNATHGRVWVAATLLKPETSKNDSGVFAAITFTVTTLGSSSLHLHDVKLGNPTVQPIAHDVIDGEVVVAHKPPLNIILLSIIIIAAAVIVLAMIIISRKKSKQP